LSIKDDVKSKIGISISILKKTTAIPTTIPAKITLLLRHINRKKKNAGIPKLIRKLSLNGYSFNSPAKGIIITISANMNNVLLLLLYRFKSLVFTYFLLGIKIITKLFCKKIK